jgi:hypothetical protein
MIFIALLLWGFGAYAGVYSDIPKTFAPNLTHVKEMKFGYNLTNNLSQKQTLFFIEGNLRNDKVNHFSRYEISNAKTEDSGTVYANTASNLFRTNTILPLKDFTTGDNPLSISGMLYARSYDFHDRLFSSNSLKDTLATLGLGFSRTNIYTVGLSIGRRKTDLFFSTGAQRGKINEYIYRPSFVYTNKVQDLIPRLLKRFLQKNSIYEFATTETSVKFEYALIAGSGTRIQQFYAGVEKNISKHIAVAVFYDYEYTQSKYQTLTNVNKIDKISTSLVIKL